MNAANQDEPAQDETSFLIYVSIATHPFKAEELRELLEVTRRKNTAAGITGLLLYKDGKFMQLLEGRKERVQRLFEWIKTDSRHRDVIRLLAGEEKERSFAEFSMGFENLDDPSVQALPGYSAYLDRPLSADAFSEDPTDAQRLLRIFKRTGLSL